MNNFLGKVLATLAVGVPAMAFAAPFQIDPSHSGAHFKVRHMMVSTVRGEFTKLSGTMQYDPAKPEAISIEATIDATSINTREEKRDAHLKSPDFFDVAKYPTLTFKSKSAKKTGKGKLAVTGDLTMHGVTKSVVLDVEGLDAEVKDPWGNVRVGAVGTTKVNRKDFGLNWNQALEAGGVLVGETVDIVIEAELVKQAEKTAEK